MLIQLCEEANHKAIDNLYQKLKHSVVAPRHEKTNAEIINKNKFVRHNACEFTVALDKMW